MRVGYVIYKADGAIARSGHCSERRVRFKARVGKLAGRKERNEKVMVSEENIDLHRIDATHKIVMKDGVPIIERKG